MLMVVSSKILSNHIIMEISSYMEYKTIKNIIILIIMPTLKLALIKKIQTHFNIITNINIIYMTIINRNRT